MSVKGALCKMELYVKWCANWNDRWINFDVQDNVDDVFFVEN